MKKLYFSILSMLLAAGTINAQLTQTNHAPALGESFMTTGVSSVGVMPGASGSGATWNFTSITTTSATTNYSVVSTASTGSASTYPSSSVSVQWGSNNNFYSSTASSLSFWGGNMSLAGTSALLTFTSPAIYAKYPMSLITTTTSMIGGNANILGQPGTFSGSVTATVDGSGTLMLPGFTIPNVLRLMTSSAYSFTFTFTNGTATQNKWEWYNPGSPKSPLFAISNTTLTSGLGTTTETLVTINSMYVLGVKEQASFTSEFSVYPNPSNGVVTLDYANVNGGTASYEIVNALGATVVKNELPSQAGASKVSLNLGNLDSGVYFVKLRVGNSTSVKKITIQ
jgi:hypothetical protein